MKANFPYSGYLYRESVIKGRTYVLLRKGPVHKIMLRSRYRMEVKLGRILSVDEQVDHKDENKFNDKLSNLQILDGGTNSKKHVRFMKGHVLKELVQTCSVCGTRFTHEKIKQSCSFSCKRELLSQSPSNRRKSESVVDKIKRLRKEGGTSYSISAELKISRNTVMKYW